MSSMSSSMSSMSGSSSRSRSRIEPQERESLTRRWLTTRTQPRKASVDDQAVPSPTKSSKFHSRTHKEWKRTNTWPLPTPTDKAAKPMEDEEWRVPKQPRPTEKTSALPERKSKPTIQEYHKTHSLNYRALVRNLW